MARSYRTDQWLGLDSKTSGESDPRSGLPGLAGSAVAGSGNDDFIYPDRLVRTVNRHGNPKVTPLKRGYIRGVNYANVTRSNLKCQFQFNPALINQSVAQNTQTLNFTQQQPEQFAQPMYGNVNFNFELFFDRSAELNNPFRSTGALRTDRPNPADPSFAETNPWQSKSPAEVGVFHDIGVFFGIVGVGIDQAMQGYIEKQSIAAYNENLDGDSEVTEALDLAQLSANIEDFVRWNAGNSAFLVPLPVRVVFSSLYVVEGFVSTVNLQLSKFNSAMVPMQCTLKVEMEAKYIGFAKKDTILTHSLQALQEVEVEDPTTPEVSQEQADALQDLRTLRVHLSGSDNFSPNVDRDFDWRSSDATDMDQFVSKADSTTIPIPLPSGSLFRIDFDNDRLLSGDPNTNENPVGMYIHGFFDAEAENRSLYRLMNDTGANITISATGTVTGYRYSQVFRALNSAIFARADSKATAGPNSGLLTSNRPYEEVERVIREALPDSSSESKWGLVNNHEGNAKDFETVAKILSVKLDSTTLETEKVDGINVASSASEWDKMARYAFKSKKQYGGKPGGVDDDLANPANFPGELDARDRIPDNNEFYFFLKFRFTITVDFGDGQKFSRTDTDYIYRPSKGTDFKAITTLEFNWPAFYEDVALGTTSGVSTGGLDEIEAASGGSDPLNSSNPFSGSNPNPAQTAAQGLDDFGYNPAQAAAIGEV